MATKVYELIAPCHFGLEAVLKKEILDLGYEIAQVEDGKVTFLGDAAPLVRRLSAARIFSCARRSVFC